MDEIKKILIQNSMHFIGVRTATPNEDMRQATDLVVTVQDGDIAVRIRRSGYRSKYRDLTIRSYNNGCRTELDKIKEGWGRWYLYLWECTENNICDWILADLNKVRELNLLENRKEIPNTDKTTRFISISADELRNTGCLVDEAEFEPGYLDNPRLYLANKIGQGHLEPGMNLEKLLILFERFGIKKSIDELSDDKLHELWQLIQAENDK